MKRTKLLPFVCAMALTLPLTSAWGSGDWPDNPKWALRKADYDSGGNSAMLSPSNDTRVNLALLLSDRAPAGKEGARPIPLFGWSTLDAELSPAATEAGEAKGAGSRCQTNAGGARAFTQAVSANGSLGDAEKSALIAARASLKPDCSGSAATGAALTVPEAKSAQARQFAAYLGAADEFYRGEFGAATAAFASLGAARDAWLRETALYMAARSELNRAQQSAFDQYGGIASPRSTDMAAAEAALNGFQSYLKAYPQGRYAASASGLIRRVHWLTGNDRALSQSYAGLLTQAAPGRHGEIAQEIDIKLLLPADSGLFTDPLLLAVADLQRMRKQDPDSEAATGGITSAQLEAQKQYFAGNPDLFSYLLAAEALYLRDRPREVLALIPDAARQQNFSYLQFSRQMLRGFALDMAGDRNARGFWLELFGGAKQPWQREALELAYAMHEERGGGLARLFAAGSPLRNPAIRELLLEHVAGPDILRQQARDKSAPPRERHAALFTLLAKQLGHGFHRKFLDDLALVPADAQGDDANFESARYWSSDRPGNDDPVPVGVFSRSTRLGDFACPSLKVTVASLVRTPQLAKPRLCLAEFWRANGFDSFEFDTPLGPDELGGTSLAVPRQALPAPGGLPGGHGGRRGRRRREGLCIIPGGAVLCAERAQRLRRRGGSGRPAARLVQPAQGRVPPLALGAGLAALLVGAAAFASRQCWRRSCWPPRCWRVAEGRPDRCGPRTIRRSGYGRGWRRKRCSAGPRRSTC